MRWARLRYVLAQLERWNEAVQFNIVHSTACAESSDLSIDYRPAGSAPHPDAIYVPRDPLLSTKKVLSATEWSIVRPFVKHDHTVYCVDTTATQHERAIPFFQNRQFGGDVFATIFFLLSRIEEYQARPTHCDPHGMLREQFHWSVRYGLEQRPVLDLLVNHFWEVLDIPKSIPAVPSRMTHDLDALRMFPSLYRFSRGVARLVRMRRWDRVFWWIKQGYYVQSGRRRDPFDTFDRMLTTTPDSTKVLYLMAGGSTRFEGFYQLNDAALVPVLQLARRRGYQFGLHPSYHTCQNYEMLTQEKERLEERLGESIHRARQHFLRFDVGQTPLILERSGITEDSTLGYQNRIGFRCGTRRPFQLYSLAEERTTNVMEVPFGVMDSALMTQADHSAIEALRILSSFLKDNADDSLVFNVHNSSFSGLFWDEVAMWELYERCTLHINDRNIS